MPRTARLDTPGLLHHIMIRGIERRRIFNDNKDRERGRWFQNNLTNGQIWNNASSCPDNQDMIRPAHCIMSWVGGLTD